MERHTPTAIYLILTPSKPFSPPPTTPQLSLIALGMAAFAASVSAVESVHATLSLLKV